MRRKEIVMRRTLHKCRAAWCAMPIFAFFLFAAKPAFAFELQALSRLSIEELSLIDVRTRTLPVLHSALFDNRNDGRIETCERWLARFASRTAAKGIKHDIRRTSFVESQRRRLANEFEVIYGFCEILNRKVEGR